jgi:hypothetical protein
MASTRPLVAATEIIGLMGVLILTPVRVVKVMLGAVAGL